MTRLVIFDLDETLLRLVVDWDGATREIVAYGKKEGLVFDEKEYIIGLSAGLSNTPARKKAVDSIWEKYELAAVEAGRIERYANAEHFVKNLKSKGFKLAIFSNNCHKTIEKALALAGIYDCFDIIMGRDNVKKTKHNPEGLEKIIEKLKIPKSETIYIGDSESDRKAGEAAGIKTIIVKPNSEFPKI